MYVAGNLTVDGTVITTSLEATGSATLHQLTIETDLQATGSAVLGEAMIEQLSVSSKHAGKLTIPANQTVVTVTYDKPFSLVPMVSITPVGRFIPYYLANETETGFELHITQPQSQVITFNWMVIGVSP